MQDKIIELPHEAEVRTLIEFIRKQQENEHFADLCADICSEFARVARCVGKVGYLLSDEWKSADHMVLSVAEYKAHLLAIHIRLAGNHDNQAVAVSQTSPYQNIEATQVQFPLPQESVQAREYIMRKVFEAFSPQRLLLSFAGEKIPLFEDDVPHLPPTSDESVLKERAYQRAAAEAPGAILRTPYADDNMPPERRSFSPQRNLA